MTPSDGAHRLSEAGTATTQLVLVMPVVLLTILLVVQLALVWHGSHVLTAAAQHAVQSAQVEGAGRGAGSRAARDFLAQTERGLLSSPRVRVRRTRAWTRAVVSAKAVSVVPGFSLRIKGVAEGPTERFRSRLER